MTKIVIIPNYMDTDLSIRSYEVSAIPQVDEYVKYIADDAVVKRRVKEITHDLINNSVHVHLSY